jgi:UDP-GlcNAc:undecaprenyl-phosphate GlcNAc-1-phosphate transferase
MELNISLKTLYEMAVQATASAILALIVGPIAIFLAHKLGAIDIPDSAAHKKHSAPTPLAGGLVLALTLPLLGTVFNLWKIPHIPQILAASVVIFIFGVWDDRRGLSAPKKFTGQILATALVIASGTSVKMIEAFRLPLPPSLALAADIGITIFWMVGVTNAFNLIDSMDGLVAGLTIISSGFFTIVSVASGQPELAQLCAILFGISISLYLYNRTPAKFFLGDSGAQVLGFLLAAVAILYTPYKLPQGSTWFLPILLLGVPIFDTTLVVVSRLRRRKHLFQADLAHTYHRLVHLGLIPRDAVRAIQIMASLLCISAMSIMTLPPLVATGLFGAIVLLGVGLIIFFEIAVKIED